jgi:hypothetical protein
LVEGEKRLITPAASQPVKPCQIEISVMNASTKKINLPFDTLVVLGRNEGLHQDKDPKLLDLQSSPDKNR